MAAFNLTEEERDALCNLLDVQLDNISDEDEDDVASDRDMYINLLCRFGSNEDS